MFDNLPEGRYNTLVVDPPWPITLAGKFSRGRSMGADKLPYKTLTVDQIKTFPVHSLANPGAHVYMWTTNRMLPESFSVLEAWGVRFHLGLLLLREHGAAPSLGYVFGAQYCLLGFYGRPMQKFLKCGKLNWLIAHAKPSKHSTKPDDFYTLVEEMSPGPRCDLFARKHRDGWDCWGDEL